MKALALAILLAAICVGCGPTKPTEDQVNKATEAGRLIGIGGCATLRTAIKPGEAAQIKAAITVVNAIVTAQCDGRECTAEEFHDKIKLLLGAEQKFVPLVASLVTAAEIFLPPDVAPNAYVAVGVGVTEGCSAGLAI